MKITKRQLRRIIREELETVTADASDAEDVAQTFADKYGTKEMTGGGVNIDDRDGSLIIHIREKTAKQFGQEITKAVEENGWRLQKFPDLRAVFVYTAKQEKKPTQKKSRLRSMFGI